MRIVQINAVYGIGSTGTIVRDLQQCCEENGIHCFVAYAYANGEVYKGYKIGSWIENKLHGLLCRIGGKQAYYSRLATRRLIRFLDKIHPDIVHLHNLHSNYIHLNMLLNYLAKKDIRTIITMHDCWWYTGGCFHYTSAGCDRWKNECGTCPKQREDPPAYLFDKSQTILHDRKKYLLAIPRLTVVGVSNWISDEARSTFLSSKRIVTIHNGVDMSIFKPTLSDLRQKLHIEGKKVILGPAMKWLDPINRDVLEYFCKNIDDGHKLLLFGYTGRLNIKIPGSVILYGYTSCREELADLYSIADVFVNPSREESLSLINVEAQSCGTPVVAFAVTGIVDTVDGDNSVAVKAGDYEMMYKTTMRIIKEGKKVDLITSFVHNNFELQKNYEQYIQLYQK